MTKYLFFTLALAIVFGVVRDARAEWSLDGGANLAYESNLGHAYENSDRREDFSLTPYLFVGRHFQLTEYSRFSLAAQGDANLFRRYDRLDALSGKLTASFRYKMGLGLYVPWVTLYGSEGAVVAAENVRNGFVSGAGVVLGQRLQERVDLQAGYAYEHGAARSFLFSQKSTVLHANLDFRLTDAVAISAGYALRRGDIVTYYQEAGDDLSPGELRLDTFQMPMTAERICATSHSLLLSLLFGLSEHVSAKVSGENRLTSYDEHSYRDNIIRLGILYSY